MTHFLGLGIPTQTLDHFSPGCNHGKWRFFWLGFPSLKIWVFPKIGVPQNEWFIMENPITMDDLGWKPTIFGNFHIMSSWWWGLHPWFHLVFFFGSEGPPSPSTEIRPPRTRTSRESSMMLVMTWMQHSKWLSPGRSWRRRAFVDKKAPKVPSECCFLSQIHQIIPMFGGGEIKCFKQMCCKV